jgi:hypothetical protein
VCVTFAEQVRHDDAGAALRASVFYHRHVGAFTYYAEVQRGDTGFTQLPHGLQPGLHEVVLQIAVAAGETASAGDYPRE